MQCTTKRFECLDLTPEVIQSNLRMLFDLQALWAEHVQELGRDDPTLHW